MGKWLWGVLLTFVACAGLSARAQSFYELSCNEVLKLDAVTGKQIGAVELASRTSLIPHESPRTAFCDLDGMTYDAARHTAAVEVNDRAHRVYRRVFFTVPEFHFLSATLSKRAWHEDGDDRTAASASPTPHVPGMITQGSQSGWLNLRGYRTAGDIVNCTSYGQGKTLLSTPVLAAGSKVILKATCAEGTRLFLADGASRQLVPLALPAEAGLAALFATSDGHYLLATTHGTAGNSGGGRAWLVDLATGSLVRAWSDSRLADAAFLGFTRHSLLFSGQGANFVLDVPVSLSPTAEGDGFFADR